jgi:hypothetical protein
MMTGPTLRGAVVVQQLRGRAALAVALVSGGNREHRQGLPKRVLRGAVPPIQVFPNLPMIDFSTAEASVGVDGRPHLPGRVSPAGWDGEQGAAAPVRY